MRIVTSENKGPAGTDNLAVGRECAFATVKAFRAGCPTRSGDSASRTRAWGTTRRGFL